VFAPPRRGFRLTLRMVDVITLLISAAAYALIFALLANYLSLGDQIVLALILVAGWLTVFIAVIAVAIVRESE